MFAFVEIADIIFGERSKLVVDPSEEQLKSQFSGVKRTYIPLHSVVALAVAAKAEAYTVEAVRGEVETSGQLTRGMTVIDRRRVVNKQSNLDLLSDIDELGVIDYFSRSFRRAAQ